MTTEQYHICQLLARCRYLPGGFEKRFARQVSEYGPEFELTVAQGDWLLKQAHRYRKQLAPLIEAYTRDEGLRLSLKALCWEMAP